MYSKIGKLIAMNLVHGGGALNVFCPAVYSFMCGMSPSDIIVSSDELPDEMIRDYLEKVCLHLISSYYHILFLLKF